MAEPIEIQEPLGIWACTWQVAGKVVPSATITALPPGKLTAGWSVPVESFTAKSTAEAIIS